MTQAEEAMEMMNCRRCGRFSGPEELCAACDDAEMLYQQMQRLREEEQAEAADDGILEADNEQLLDYLLETW